MQQRVEQRAVGMPGRRMHHQPGRLVDHQNLVVFIDDVERNVLRHPFALRLLFGAQLEHRTGMHGVAGAQHGAIHRQQTILDPGREARTRVFGEELRRDLIETLPA